MAIASTFGPCSMTTDIVLDLAAAVIAAVSLPGAPYGSPSTEAGQMAPNRPWMLELGPYWPFSSLWRPRAATYAFHGGRDQRGSNVGCILGLYDG